VVNAKQIILVLKTIFLRANILADENWTTDVLYDEQQ